MKKAIILFTALLTGCTTTNWSEFKTEWNALHHYQTRDFENVISETEEDALMKAYNYANQCNGSRFYFKDSGSMSNNWKGDGIGVLENADYKNIHIGDVIAFHRKGERTVHMIIGKDSEGYLTAGSSNEAIDKEKVTRDEYEGLVKKMFTWKVK